MKKRLFHSWGDWEIDGEKCIATRRCTNQNCSYCREEKEMHDYGEWQYGAPDSCQLIRTCQNPTCAHNQIGEIRHNFGEWVYIQSNSCTKMRKCVRCGEIQYKEIEHNFGPWQYYADGVCEQRSVCKCCGIAKYRMEHKYGEPITRSRECVAEKTCCRCGDVIVEQASHDWTDKIPYSQCIQIVIDDHKRRRQHLTEISKSWGTNEPNYFSVHAEIGLIDQKINDLYCKAQIVKEGDLAKLCKHCNRILYYGQIPGQKKGFLSYSHHEMAYANQITDELQADGLTIIRDIMDLKVSDHLQRFMSRVSESNYVVLILSEEYLQSKNCMYEAVEIVSALANGPCKLFTFVVSVNITQDAVKEYWQNYWNMRLEESIVQQESPHDIEIYRSIKNNIWEFLMLVAEYKYEYINDGEPIAGHIIKSMLQKIREINEI